jgi:hypothetical protein
LLKLLKKKEQQKENRTGRGRKNKEEKVEDEKKPLGVDKTKQRSGARVEKKNLV